MTLEDGVKQVLALLIPHIRHQQTSTNRSGPIVLGLSGLQGSGKSTWASQIVKTFRSKYNVRAITVSLDDFYRTHEELVALRNGEPQNRLFRTRGQPGTHDEHLAHDFFESVKNLPFQSEARIPVFDKSAFNGEGDRASVKMWPKIATPIDVLVFEGWCVGFRPLKAEHVQQKWRSSCELPISRTNTLREHSIDHLLEVNSNLARYCETFMGSRFFDLFIHLDTNDLHNVYTWRLQQEHALIGVKGTGMTDGQVEEFIRGYMPGYELYLDDLRKGIFKDSDETIGRKHIRILLDRNRDIKEVQET